MRRFTSLLAAAVLTGAAAVALLTTAASGAAPAMPTINLTMNGSSITAAGTELSGAVNVVSNVTGVNQAQPRLIYLFPGVSDHDALNAIVAHGGDPDYLQRFGLVEFDAFAGQGTSSVQTELQPGHYLAIDTESNDPATWPHTDITIATNPAPAALPGASQSEKTIDFAFHGNKHLHDGWMTRFSNAGFESHMIVAVRAKDEKSAKKLAKLMIEGKVRQPRSYAHGVLTFAGPLSPGAVQQFVLNEKPGWYVLASFMSTQDGRLQTRLGMARWIEITG